jgi:hypothetical protein
MDQEALVRDQIDAAAKFIGEFQKYLPVEASFWLRDANDGDWSLYVVSDRITDDNFDVAYGEVLRIAQHLQDPSFDPFQVKLIGQDDPLAEAAREIQQRYPGRIPTWYHGNTFGGMSVDRVYIYPPPLTVPTPQGG